MIPTECKRLADLPAPRLRQAGVELPIASVSTHSAREDEVPNANL